MQISRAEQYRATARELRLLAQSIADGDARRDLEELAERFERLAQHARGGEEPPVGLRVSIDRLRGAGGRCPS